MKERILIVGGGISGLAAASFLADKFYCRLLEKEEEIGGYCRTLYQDGFTWDYSGHFFHFRHQWVRDYVERHMDRSGILGIRKISRVFFRGSYVDYPFQFNIHQLPLPDLLRCLFDMHEAQKCRSANYGSFREMVYGRYGRALSDMFLLPYNEKLYATTTDRLDPDAMGRFFPHIDFGTLLAKLSGQIAPDTYNDVFTYHRRGAKAYVDALATYIPAGVIRTGAGCTGIDLDRHAAYVGNERLVFDRMVISAPLPRIMELVGEAAPPTILTANKVLVFNLGFDRPSIQPDHWVYYPEPEWIFFRVGHYDKILGEPRMSLYVEIAMPSDAIIDIAGLLQRVLSDLAGVGVITEHRLVSHAHVVLDPAYVHVSNAANAFAEETCARLEARGVFPLGRYGRWTYCSIEDNIVMAHRLARAWGAAESTGPPA
jgi:protoporphyrinogen oxidase